MEEQGTFLVTKLPLNGKDWIVSAFYENGRAAELSCSPPGAGSLLGNIYVGKVKNILANINAAFVEIADGVLCYYPLAEQEEPLYTSPKKSGKLVAGDEILVQVSREAVKTKAPTVTCNLNFAGKYLVLTTGKKGLGISAKLDRRNGSACASLQSPFFRRISASSSAQTRLARTLRSFRRSCPACPPSAREPLRPGSTRPVFPWYTGSRLLTRPGFEAFPRTGSYGFSRTTQSSMRN